MFDLVLQNVEIDGRAGLNVAVQAGHIVEITTERLHGKEEIEGNGGALIPGLADQHLHLLSLAAQAQSLNIADASTFGETAQRLKKAVSQLAPGAWLRVTGYHDSTNGPLDRAALDRLAPLHPVRVQHQSGAFWLLNSAALDQVLDDKDWPDCVERNENGAATGRIWRGDAWLNTRLKRTPPSLHAIGRRMAAFGITAITDASVTNDAISAAYIAREIRAGALPQRVMLMSGGELSAADEYVIGPVKILLDDANLPTIEWMTQRIEAARRCQRAVAVHCVTAAELAFTLAAFATAGSRDGDRIEHGGVISREAIEQVALLGLTVVTQPAFIFERGDRYLRDVEEEDVCSLYRAASLIGQGIGLAGSSDAPYATIDPWAAMRSAVQRVTHDGVPVGASERLSPQQALNLYLKEAFQPGGPPRRVYTGVRADLCLLRDPLRDIFADFQAETVAATIIDGRPVYRAG
jgi:predicted amidohydrolase YtcJ